MLVTVRQIDKIQHCQSVVPSDLVWKPYVDRLFDQGYSSEEIQRLLHEAAAASTMPCDDNRLKDVFNYIDRKTKEQRANPASSRITSTAASSEINSITDQLKQSSNVFESMQPIGATDSNNELRTSVSSSSSVNDFIMCIYKYNFLNLTVNEQDIK